MGFCFRFLGEQQERNRNGITFLKMERAVETLHHLVLMDDAAVWIVWKRIELIGGLRSTAPFYHSPAQ